MSGELSIKSTKILKLKLKIKEKKSYNQLKSLNGADFT